MRQEDAVMLILDDHHTIIRTQRVVAVNVTLRRRGEGKQLPQHLLGCGQIGANVINPAFDRRLGNRNQEQRSKKDRNVPETDSTYHREGSVLNVEIRPLRKSTTLCFKGS